ncbi:DivIVA domain-containing protein [[Mycoplasma] collis]|uniref:DivIVA domain-containing protein n=1 Tax=[Mycoplasma] collis TaxID=2127 RepID=UPI00051CA92C|nr:DivIVA domain-containing protein [[Mycoplasma] collis]
MQNKKEIKYEKYIKEILDKKFDVSINGYDPEQVDLFFDNSIVWINNLLEELKNTNNLNETLKEENKKNLSKIEAQNQEIFTLKEYIKKLNSKKEII